MLLFLPPPGDACHIWARFVTVWPQVPGDNSETHLLLCTCTSGFTAMQGVALNKWIRVTSRAVQTSGTSVMFVFRGTFDKSHNFLAIRWAQKVLNLTERHLSPALLESASPKGAVSKSTTICLPTTLCLASGLRQMYTCFLIRQHFSFYPVSFPGFFHWRVSIGKARSTACDPSSLAECT